MAFIEHFSKLSILSEFLLQAEISKFTTHNGNDDSQDKDSNKNNNNDNSSHNSLVRARAYVSGSEFDCNEFIFIPSISARKSKRESFLSTM